MAEAVSVEAVAEAMYQMVKEAAGVKKLKPTDLTKAMLEHFGPERCSKDLCKEALRRLMDSGRCVYTYFGGSFVELPPKEGQAA
jgi:hypothetical protein